MKNIYVMLDNNMEVSTVNAYAYSTYEKAKKALKEAIQNVKDQYEGIEESEDECLFTYDDTPARLIKIEASLVN